MKTRNYRNKNSLNGGYPSTIFLLTLLLLYLSLNIPTISSYPTDPHVTLPDHTLWNDTWTIEDLSEELHCEELFNTQRPIHSNHTWIYLQSIYLGILTPLHSSIYVPSTSTSLTHTSSFLVPYEVRQTAYKGRGIFATAPIPQSTLVWDARNTARFTTGCSYRKFLQLIPEDIACDVMQWAYVQDVEGGYEIYCDLEDGSFMNSGGWVDDDVDWKVEDENVGCELEEEDDCFLRFYALRDIEVGEEILCEYGSFAVADGWEEFDL